MAKEPSHRFGDAQALIEALESMARDHGGQSRALFLKPAPELISPSLPLDETGEETPHGRITKILGRGMIWQRWLLNRIGWSEIGIAAAIIAAAASWYYWQQPSRDLQAEHVLEQLLAYEGTQPIQTLIGQPQVQTPYSTYTFALALARGDTKVLEGLKRLADRFEARARRQWQEGQWDQALLLVKQGLHFKPDHERLLILQPFMTRQIEAKRQRQRIKDLLTQAQQHFAQSRLTEPKGNNAFDTYNAVLALAPKDQEALRGLAQIAERLEQRAREAHQQGDIQGSLALIEQGLHVEPQHKGLQALRDRANQPPEKQDKRRRLIAQWLDQAQTQLDAGRLAHPPGDNAFETYRLILIVAPGEAKALSGVQLIAERYLQLAQTQKRGGDLKASLSFIEQGLQTVPGHPGLLELRNELASRQASTLQALLSKAERQLVSSQLTKPRGNNALETYKEVLRIDPGNHKAKEGMRMIVQHYETLAISRQQAGSLQEALVLINEGLRIEPDNGGLLAQRRAILVSLGTQRRPNKTN
jgi:tetratricopeptide (TPR) repeat protein